MRHKLLIYLFVCILHNSHAQPIQRYSTYSYNVNEGLLQSSIYDIAFDNNNFCWLSFPNGIQKFDGTNFINVPVQAGLPDDKSVRFFTTKSGQLFASHIMGISWYDIDRNRFVQIYYLRNAGSLVPLFAGEDEGIIYFYHHKQMTGIDAVTFKQVSTSSLVLPNGREERGGRVAFSEQIFNHKVIVRMDSAVYRWDFQQKKIVGNSQQLIGPSYYYIGMENEKVARYFSFTDSIALREYNFETSTDSILYKQKASMVTAFRGGFYNWQGKSLLYTYNEVFEVGYDLSTPKGRIVDFNNQPLAATSIIAKITEDRYGNLYLITINNGIRKVIRNNYDLRYFGSGNREGNFIVSLLEDKKRNRVLAGTYGNGLLIFDNFQQLVRHFPTLPGRQEKFSPTAIIQNNKDEYLIFVFGELNVWKLSADLQRMTEMKIPNVTAPHNTFGYFGNVVYRGRHEGIVGTTNALYRVDLDHDNISYHALPFYISGPSFYKSQVVGYANDQLYFFDSTSFAVKRSLSIKNTAGVRCMVATSDALYIGSNKGIFRMDSNDSISLYLNREMGLPDECIYAMSIDQHGSLWCSTNKGILRITADKKILHLKKENGLQENEFNTGIVNLADDGEIFFGGVNGVTSLFPNKINTLSEKIEIIWTSIKVNNEDAFRDTGVWHLQEIRLPFSRNSVSFDFIATGPDNSNQYVYQYKMKGIDEEWILSSEVRNARYFLQPGRYVFQVYASRFFDANARPLKEIVIIIRPPFWKTWWFLGAVLLILCCTLFFSINRFNKRKYQKRLQALENERGLKLERERISRDLHDSLGAYANAVLYNTELLQNEKNDEKQKELVKDIRFASKDIITSLRETIWVLNKDTFTADDCLLRVRNFIQPFNRYYAPLQFKVEGDAPANFRLHSTRALHLVRIIQEAVSNSIKHAQAKNIIIHSAMINEKWELTIRDDGKGFDFVATKKEERGNGLGNMLQRSQDAGFGITITSNEDGGTSIRIIVSQ